MICLNLTKIPTIHLFLSCVTLSENLKNRGLGAIDNAINKIFSGNIVFETCEGSFMVFEALQVRFFSNFVIPNFRNSLAA